MSCVCDDGRQCGAEPSNDISYSNDFSLGVFVVNDGVLCVLLLLYDVYRS